MSDSVIIAANNAVPTNGNNILTFFSSDLLGTDFNYNITFSQKIETINGNTVITVTGSLGTPKFLFTIVRTNVNDKKYDEFSSTNTSDISFLKITSEPLSVKIKVKSDVYDLVFSAANNIDLSTVNGSIIHNKRFTFTLPGPIFPISINKIRIPQITGFGQSTINGEQISDITFLIKDNVSYENRCECRQCKIDLYDRKSHCECRIRYVEPSTIVTTKYVRSFPPLFNIIEGAGNTLYEKIKSLISMGNNITIQKILGYAMLKYILAKLMYGEFHIKYLVRGFHSEFIEDLGTSRFCQYLEVFEDPSYELMDYDLYFKE